MSVRRGKWYTHQGRVGIVLDLVGGHAQFDLVGSDGLTTKTIVVDPSELVLAKAADIPACRHHPEPGKMAELGYL